MDREAILHAVESERLDLADLLDRLVPADWDVASCAQAGRSGTWSLI